MRVAMMSGACRLAIVLTCALPVCAQNQIGRLTSAGTASARTFHQYDEAGRTTRTIYVYDSVARSTISTYGYPHDAGAPAGQGALLIARTYPDGERVTYDYDRGDAIVALRAPSGAIVESIRRNARSQQTELSFGNGVVTRRRYNDSTDLRLHDFVTRRSVVAAPFQSVSYDYDANGNVTRMTDGVASALSASYEYDSLDRITKMLNGSGSVEEMYDYDAAGNLIQKGGVSQTYGGAGRGPHAIASAGTSVFQYDANGNVTGIVAGSLPIHSLVWNSENMAVRQVARVGAFDITTDKSFVGETLWKKVQGTDTTYYLPSVRVENGVLRKFYEGYAERSPEDGRLRFYHPDHLGSSSVMTDDTGALIRRVGYRPWGEDRAGDTTLTFVPRYQFNFKEREPSGFYDYGGRLYNPFTGRWLSPDDDLDGGINRYTYVRNNPVRYTDPDGHQTKYPSDWSKAKREQWEREERELREFNAAYAAWLALPLVMAPDRFPPQPRPPHVPLHIREGMIMRVLNAPVRRVQPIIRAREATWTEWLFDNHTIEVKVVGAKVGITFSEDGHAYASVGYSLKAKSFLGAAKQVLPVSIYKSSSPPSEGATTQVGVKVGPLGFNFDLVKLKTKGTFGWRGHEVNDGEMKIEAEVKVTGRMNFSIP